MSSNPYDRRRTDRGDGQVRDLIAEQASDGFAPLSVGPKFLGGGLELEDLQAMAGSARSRGEMRATERLLEQHHEERLAARREAWDEGHAQGGVDVRMAILNGFERLHAPGLRGSHSVGMELLQRLSDDPKKVTKAELATAVERFVSEMAVLLNAHHAGFQGAERAGSS